MKMLQKLTIVGVFSLLALAIAPPPSQAQTAITFSGLADGTLVTTQYQNLGLTFSSTDPGGPQARITGGAIPGPDYLCPGVKGSSDQFNGTIVVLFSAPVNSFGSSIADGPTTLMGFAANGQKQTVSYAGGQKHATLNLDPGFEIVKATFTGTFYCLDFISFKGGFRILQPKDATQVSLTQTSFTETSPVSFEAGPIAPSATVKWTARLEYATSGRLGGFTDSRPFTTDATTHVHDETYTGIGGKITVDASQDTPAVAAT